MGRRLEAALSHPTITGKLFLANPNPRDPPVDQAGRRLAAVARAFTLRLGRLWKGLLLTGRADGLSVAAMLLGVLATAALTRRGSRKEAGH